MSFNKDSSTKLRKQEPVQRPLVHPLMNCAPHTQDVATCIPLLRKRLVLHHSADGMGPVIICQESKIARKWSWMDRINVRSFTI